MTCRQMWSETPHNALSRAYFRMTYLMFLLMVTVYILCSQKAILGLISWLVISAQTCPSNVTSILTGLLMLAAALWEFSDTIVYRV